jgi:signal peptidase
VKFLTKGDNNNVDDRGLYAPGQLWLSPKDVVGRARGFVPHVGIVTILMNDYPKLKVICFLIDFSNLVARSTSWLTLVFFSTLQYFVLACLGIFVLIHRE